MTLVIKNQPANSRYVHRFYPWVGKNPLEKEMATHSSNLAWRTPWAEKPGRLQSIGSQRAGHE